MVMDLKVLAIHLKRFTYNERLDRLTKLSHRVVFPFELRLSNTTDDAEAADTAYDLASSKHTHTQTRHAHAQTRTHTDTHTYRHTCVYIYILFGKKSRSLTLLSMYREQWTGERRASVSRSVRLLHLLLMLTTISVRALCFERFCFGVWNEQAAVVIHIGSQLSRGQ